MTRSRYAQQGDEVGSFKLQVSTACSGCFRIPCAPEDGQPQPAPAGPGFRIGVDCDKGSCSDTGNGRFVDKDNEDDPCGWQYVNPREKQQKRPGMFNGLKCKIKCDEAKGYKNLDGTQYRCVVDPVRSTDVWWIVLLFLALAAQTDIDWHVPEQAPGGG
jgi:hypothetical protein